MTAARFRGRIELKGDLNRLAGLKLVPTKPTGLTQHRIVAGAQETHLSTISMHFFRLVHQPDLIQGQKLVEGC